jgi:hypothetical protein
VFFTGADDSTFIASNFKAMVGDYTKSNSIVNSNYWRQNIYTRIHMPTDPESSCAKRCMMTPVTTCHFYWYGNNYCHLARLGRRFGTNYAVAPYNDQTVIQFRSDVGKYFI